jgi:hypothetical protein
MASDDVLVEQVRSLLGARLTAYLVGRASTNMDDLKLLEKMRLGYLLQVTEVLNSGRANMSGVTTQTWWKGMNPMLNDSSPAQVFRDPSRLPEVFAAARHDSNA